MVLEHFIRALDDLATAGTIDPKKVVVAGGIGCSGFIPTYLKLDAMHTLHGRAVAVATGIKLANPNLNVIVFGGDGDNLSIGGNHFIHAARRNIDVKVVMINNSLYGMTGGQVAPTTPIKTITHTTPYGNMESPFDGCKLAEAAGATFVARWTTSHPYHIISTFKKMMTHRGFSYVEILSQCPIYFGRYIVGMEEPSEILNYFAKNSISVQDARTKGDVQGKFVVGEFLHVQKATFESLLNKETQQGASKE
jgi:2-oxoglutarate ferredoxin oxidoreductase subunit beta